LLARRRGHVDEPSGDVDPDETAVALVPGGPLPEVGYGGHQQLGLQLHRRHGAPVRQTSSSASPSSTAPSTAGGTSHVSPRPNGSRPNAPASSPSPRSTTTMRNAPGPSGHDPLVRRRSAWKYGAAAAGNSCSALQPSPSETCRGAGARSPSAS